MLISVALKEAAKSFRQNLTKLGSCGTIVQTLKRERRIFFGNLLRTPIGAGVLFVCAWFSARVVFILSGSAWVHPCIVDPPFLPDLFRSDYFPEETSKREQNTTFWADPLPCYPHFLGGLFLSKD